MNKKTIRVRLTFIDSILGGESTDKELYKNYILGKIPPDLYSEEERKEIEDAQLEALMEGDEKGKTVFYRNPDGEPCLANNHIKGFFKSACGAMRTDKSTISSKITAYKTEIDRKVFVFADASDKKNRFIPIQNYGEIGQCQRPLRAMTMQGERVALANSEEIGAGAFVEFDVEVLKHDKKPLGTDLIEEWLEFGEYNGLGQWRNSGHGAFTYEVIEK